MKTKLSDSEINALVAEKVAGFTRKNIYGWGDRLIWHDGIAPLMNWGVSSEGDGYSEPWEPDYLNSADAVLPLLHETLGCEASWIIAGVRVRVTVRGEQTPDNPLAHVRGEAIASTFPRAACAALLKSKGIEVHRED